MENIKMYNTNKSNYIKDNYYKYKLSKSVS